jgi:hypothetical protein
MSKQETKATEFSVDEAKGELRPWIKPTFKPEPLRDALTGMNSNTDGIYNS